MTLCTLCQSIPFSSLPGFLDDSMESWCIGDNEDLIAVWPCTDDSKAPGDPLGFRFQDNMEAVAASADLCVLCAVIQTGAQAWIDHYRHAELQYGLAKWYQFPSGQKLWLAKRPGGAEGFVVLVRNPGHEKNVYLLTGVGFSVEAGEFS